MICPLGTEVIFEPRQFMYQILHVLMIFSGSINLIAFAFKGMLKITVCFKVHLLISSNLAIVIILDFKKLTEL